MRQFNSLKAVRDECGISAAFTITHLNSQSIFETKNGMLGATIKLVGIPFVTEQPEKLNYFKHLWHQALLRLDENYACYTTIHRTQQNIQLEGIFNSQFAKTINDKYHARFLNSKLYNNEIYLTLVYKGLTSGKAGNGLALLKRLSDKTITDARNVRREQNIKQLTSKMQQLLASLSAFKPKLLGTCDEQLGYSELLAFLSFSVNAGKFIPFKFKNFAPAIATSIDRVPQIEQLYPYGNLSQHLSSYQLFFGDVIQFQGATSNDVSFAAMLSIKHYPTASCSIMFNQLLQLDSEFMLTHSFIPEENSLALQHIQLQRAKLTGTYDKAASQIDALADAEDNLASGLNTLGYHHHTLMLLQKSKAELEQALNQAVKAYTASGTTVIKETLGQEAAFWAQIPGHQHFIARASLITSENFTDFNALHNYPTGYRDANHLGGAITLLETPSRTPVFFNYHVPGAVHNPSKGHTLIIGGNNAGKTTFATFVDAQMEKYGGRTFYLDRDRGAELYIRAVNGKYLTIAPSHAADCQQNPLQLLDTPENRQFLKEWLHYLVKKENEVEVPSDIAEQLSECIDYSFEQLQINFRNLSNITKILPINFARWPELRRWLRGNDKYPDGDHAWIFDNDVDALNLNCDKVGFDITYLMDGVTPTIATPVYMVLLHRMRQCLYGRLTSIIID